MALRTRVSIGVAQGMIVLLSLMRVVDLYKGSFVDGKMEGFGKYVSPSGVEYEGEPMALRTRVSDRVVQIMICFSFD